MKIFFDTEFTGLHKNTTLISIGLVSECGCTFYAELTDYDKAQCNEWINNNVVNNLLYEEGFSNIECGFFNSSIRLRGNKEKVHEYLNAWLEQFENIEFISDVSHYDFVLLIDLLCGNALNLPYGVINAACHDINQDIAQYYKISEIQAFDKSREEILSEHNICIEGKKHNALYDAAVIRFIYEIIEYKDYPSGKRTIKLVY